MKIRSTVAVLSVVSFCFLTTGCASIVSGNHQSVSVETPQAKDMTCTLSNNQGKWFVNKTPGSVTIQQSFGDMMVHCEKDGHSMSDAKIKSTVKPIYFGNIIFGGMIGLIIDAGDGAGFAYPANITVPAENPTK